MKPGYRTTEFVAMVAALVVAGLVAAGVLAPDQREGATQALSEAAMAGIALWGALRAVVSYIEGRTALKTTVGAGSKPDRTPAEPQEGAR